MSLQLNSVNGSVTLVPENGAGNVNVIVPRGGWGLPLTWYTPTFVNSWVDNANGFDARYTKDLTNGIVYMKGLVRAGSNTANTTIFTLPVGMRPSTNTVLSQLAYGGVSRLDIYPSGAVQFVGTDAHTGNAAVWLSISATFKGEQ